MSVLRKAFIIAAYWLAVFLVALAVKIAFADKAAENAPPPVPQVTLCYLQTCVGGTK